MLRSDSEHFFGDDVGGHDIEGAEKEPIVPHVSLSDIVCQDVLFIWVLLEVLLESPVADKLLLELKYFLLGYRFVAQVADDALDTGFRLRDLRPDHGQTSDHVVSSESLS